MLLADTANFKEIHTLVTNSHTAQLNVENRAEF